MLNGTLVLYEQIVTIWPYAFNFLWRHINLLFFKYSFFPKEIKSVVSITISANYH